VYRLYIGGNELGDGFLALGKNFAERAKVAVEAGFLERAPIHSS
jgi:hypothetical protein